MEAKIESLTLKTAKAAMLALADLDAQGFKYSITSTRRTALEQAAYFAQGREPLVEVNKKRKAAGFAPIGSRENAYTITNCDGYTFVSNHQSGRALDVVPSVAGCPIWPAKTDPRWLVIATAFEKQGFKWGGRWEKFPDYPHYELDA